MNRRLLLPVAAVLFVAGGIASAGGVTTIAIDGKDAGTVVSWEGGDARADVALLPSGTDGTSTKQPGNISWAPLFVQCAFPPSDPLQAWLVELCSNKSSSKRIVLTDYDTLGKATGATEFVGAVLSEVQFAEIDAMTMEFGNTTFVFRVERSSEIAPVAAAAGFGVRGSISTFRLSIDGLDGTGVTKIGPVAIRRSVTIGDIGETRAYSSTVGPVEFSNLTAILQHATAATWRGWFNDFILGGKAVDANEKNGALEFLSGDAKSVLFALRFENMGILRLSRVSAADGATEIDEAELYFERMSLGAAASDSGTSGVSDGKEGGSEETQGSGTSEGKEEGGEETPGAGEAGGKDGETTDDGATDGAIDDTTETSSDTTALNLGDRSTIGGRTITDATDSPTRAGMEMVKSSTFTTTNLNDVGSRDPAEFPRVEGLTRLYYNGWFQPTYTQEEASYTTPERIYEVVPRVDAAARAAGWSLASVSESDSANGKSVGQRWIKPGMEANVTFLQPKDGPTKIKVSTTLQKPAE